MLLPPSARSAVAPGGEGSTVATTAHRLHPPADIHEHIPKASWHVYRDCLRAAAAHELPCAVGGGLAVSLYTGAWHTPHDLDLLIEPRHRPRAVAAMADAGLVDYHDREPYDRSWIYRGVRDGAVVDAIWATANGVAEVDDAWTAAGPMATMGDATFRLVPPEELVFSKLYVLQSARCDWPDVVNLLFAASPALDWDRLIARCAAAGDEKLLASALLLFAWIAPGRACAVPAGVWERLGLKRPAERAPLASRTRIDRLDSRPWFAAGETPR